MTEVVLREAKPADRDAILEVTLAAYQQYAAVMPPVHWQLYRQDIVATLADVTPALQIVAEQNGAVVGAALLYPGDMEASTPNGAPVTLASPELRLLAVAPAARGHGIGAAIVADCIARARASGAAELTLHTTDMMSVALRMYERMGFVHAPELDFHPAPGVTVKGYRLSLVAMGSSAAATEADASRPLMILIAGPYRSGTNDDPELIAANVEAMNEMALRVFRAGHLPVLGEWFALPLIETAGSRRIGDETFNEIFHPVARRLVAHCDACLRIGGASKGADEMVALARDHGKMVFTRFEDIPR